MSSDGFEYKNKDHETPFETFLRYTDEKEKSATKLADIFRKVPYKTANILDIGTGNGEFLDMALSHLDGEVLDGMHLTLLEPSDDLAYNLERRFLNSIPSTNINVVNSDIQNFKSNRTFDIILMSHLFYHLPRKSWADFLNKAISMLNDEGVLIIILRDKDDAYDFKMAIMPLLFSDSFKAITIDDVIEALPKEQKLSVKRKYSYSNLQIPLDTSFEDVVSIIEFYLNKQWAEIPAHIQQISLEFIKKKSGIFKQVDGIAIVSRDD